MYTGTLAIEGSRPICFRQHQQLNSKYQNELARASHPLEDDRRVYMTTEYNNHNYIYKVIVCDAWPGPIK